MLLPSSCAKAKLLPKEHNHDDRELPRGRASIAGATRT